MSHLYTVHEQSRSILFSSDGSKVFPTSSLTHCTAIPANANVKKGRKKKEQNKYHMHQHTAYQNNFQLGDNVLYQWNSHRLLSVLLRTTGAALLQPWPCSVGLTARGSWGDVARLLHTCTHTHAHVWTHLHAASSVVCRSVRTGAYSWLKVLVILQALSVAWPCYAVFDGGNCPSAPRIK